MQITSRILKEITPTTTAVEFVVDGVSITTRPIPNTDIADKSTLETEMRTSYDQYIGKVAKENLTLAEQILQEITEI